MAKSGKLVRVERGIFKRHGRFVVFVYTGKKSTYAGTVDTLTEARDIQGETRTVTKERVAHGKAPTPADTESFNAFALAWLSRKLVTMKASTHRSTTALVNHTLIGTFGATPLRKLTTVAIEDGFSRMRRRNGSPLSPKSLRNIAQVLRELLGDAVRRDALSAVPDFRLPIKREDMGTKQVTIHPPSVMQQVIAAMPSPYKEAALLAALTGMRQGEVLALKWEDVTETSIAVKSSRDQSGVLTTPKTRAGRRSFPIPPEVAAFLKGYRETQQPPSPYLFPVSHLGSFKGKRNDARLPVLDDSALRKAFVSACGKVGIKARFHDLRHVFASQMIAAGGQNSLLLLAACLGHSSAAFSMKQYGHLFHDAPPDFLRGVASAYSTLLPRAESNSAVQTQQKGTAET